MTQGTRKQTTEPILGTPILGIAILGTAFPWCVRLSSNIPGFVSVDLIGENNQVILEFCLNTDGMFGTDVLVAFYGLSDFKVKWYYQ